MADLALERLARRYGVTKREMIERLAAAVDDQVQRTLELDTPEWDAYFGRGTALGAYATSQVAPCPSRPAGARVADRSRRRTTAMAFFCICSIKAGEGSRPLRATSASPI